MADGLREKLQDWLSSQGYPLEMRVARTFQTHGFMALQGTSYDDPATNGPREIDVVALVACSLEFHDKRRGLITYEFSTECKTTRGKPWVVFAVDEEFSFRSLPAWDFGISSFAICVSDAISKATKQSLKLPFPPALYSLPRGYAATVAFREPSSHDLAYQAMLSAAGAARHSNRQDEPGPNGGNNHFFFCHAAFPLVVVDQPIFLAALTPQNTIELKETTGAVVSVLTEAGQRRVILLQANALDNFLKAFQPVLDEFREAWTNLSPEDLANIWSETWSHVAARLSKLEP